MNLSVNEQQDQVKSILSLYENLGINHRYLLLLLCTQNQRKFLNLHKSKAITVLKIQQNSSNVCTANEKNNCLNGDHYSEPQVARKQ